MLTNLSYDTALTGLRAGLEAGLVYTYPKGAKGPRSSLIKNTTTIAAVADGLFFTMELTGRNVPTVLRAGLFVVRLVAMTADMFWEDPNSAKSVENKDSSKAKAEKLVSGYMNNLLDTVYRKQIHETSGLQTISWGASIAFVLFSAVNLPRAAKISANSLNTLVILNNLINFKIR